MTKQEHDQVDVVAERIRLEGLSPVQRLALHQDLLADLRAELPDATVRIIDGAIAALSLAQVLTDN